MNDFNERILCSDGNCIGTINKKGICNICGKPQTGEDKSSEKQRKEKEKNGGKRREEERVAEVNITPFIMEYDTESKAILVKKQIEKDFNQTNLQELEIFFDKFLKDNRTLSFIEYYNKTVLDKERIKFSQFKRQWAIQGMTKEIYTYFDENHDQLKGEIITKKDISSFFENYCTRDRREGSFCSKLFHTFFPSEFPPVDNPIRRRFNLKNEDFITSVLIIKKATSYLSRGTLN
jgi:hypothetical protein